MVNYSDDFFLKIRYQRAAGATEREACGNSEKVRSAYKRWEKKQSQVVMASACLQRQQLEPKKMSVPVVDQGPGQNFLEFKKLGLPGKAREIAEIIFCEAYLNRQNYGLLKMAGDLVKGILPEFKEKVDKKKGFTPEDYLRCMKEKGITPTTLEMRKLGQN